MRSRGSLGSDRQLNALAHVYKTPIHVYQGDAPIVKLGEESFHEREPLRIVCVSTVQADLTLQLLSCSVRPRRALQFASSKVCLIQLLIVPAALRLSSSCAPLIRAAQCHEMQQARAFYRQSLSEPTCPSSRRCCRTRRHGAVSSSDSTRRC